MSQFPPNSPLHYATPPGYVGSINRPGRFRKGLFGWIVFIALGIMLVLVIGQSKKAIPEIPLNEFCDHLIGGDVASLRLEADSVVGVYRSPTNSAGLGLSVTHFKAVLPTGTAGNWSFTQWLLENRHGAQIEVSNDAGLLTTIVLPLVPWILIFGFIWFFVLRNLRKMGTGARPGLPAGPIEVIIVNREPK